VASLGIAMLLSFAATATLVWIALRPIVELESVAERVSGGDFGARVTASEVADRQILRLSGTMNRLLERVESDRSRIQHLAGRQVRARDIERESVARELRESFAQTGAAIAMLISAARNRSEDPVAIAQLESAGETLTQLIDEMRSVAETLYPGTLEEFGLVNAIEALSRRVARRSGIKVTVDADGFNSSLSSRAASALYRVAEEALRNVEQHARARHARVTLTSNGVASLEIEDDGRGIELQSNDPMQAGLGLFSARAVLALTGGELQISSGPDLGTRVTAHVPFIRENLRATA